MMEKKRLADALAPSRQFALIHLLEAYQTSLKSSLDTSDFACQMSGLQGLGVTDNTLRWLVAEKFAEHLLETTKPNQQRRTFRASPNLRFTSYSCFSLTESGVTLGESLAAMHEPRLDPAHAKVEGNLPHYDPSRRRLLVEGKIVKEFKRRAENQELLMIAFEEEQWPSHLADPLPGKAGLDAKRRLNEAIKNLNRGQINPLLRFHGDGTGKGIYWEYLT